MISETRIIMGMPVTVKVVDKKVRPKHLEAVFSYFMYVDETFSTFKDLSEITKINRGLIPREKYSHDMEGVFLLCDETKRQTDGYFDIVNNQGRFDPSGLVKGWAILNAGKILEKYGLENFYVEAGGDIQVHGKNEIGEPWSVGIKNPFNPEEIIKVVYLKNNEGIATSGTYERGSHIYNPKNRQQQLAEITSITVIGPNVYEADRFATAVFAMQDKGIYFIEHKKGLEAYAIDKNGIATMTTGFEKYVI